MFLLDEHAFVTGTLDSFVELKDSSEVPMGVSLNYSLLHYFASESEVHLPSAELFPLVKQSKELFVLLQSNNLSCLCLKLLCLHPTDDKRPQAPPHNYVGLLDSNYFQQASQLLILSGVCYQVPDCNPVQTSSVLGGTYANHLLLKCLVLDVVSQSLESLGG